MSHITTPDLIEREAAEAAVTAVAIHWGITGEPAILIAVKDALCALPAAPDGAEVERLRAQLSEMSAQYTRACQIVDKTCAERDALKAEVEKLRSAKVALARMQAQKTALPRLTEEMIRAACIAHYGKKLVGNSTMDSVGMTVNGIDYSFRQAFSRMWSGVRAALRAERKGDAA